MFIDCKQFPISGWVALGWFLNFSSPNLKTPTTSQFGFTDFGHFSGSCPCAEPLETKGPALPLMCYGHSGSPQQGTPGPWGQQMEGELAKIVNKFEGSLGSGSCSKLLPLLLPSETGPITISILLKKKLKHKKASADLPKVAGLVKRETSLKTNL